MSVPPVLRRHPLLVPVGVALFVRVAWALFDVPDYWGDAYHNWLVERLTLENGFTYTDYKGRELVWLPLFRYLAAAVMGVTGFDGLLPGRLVSIAAGTAAVGLVAGAASRWTGRTEWGVFAGLLLALNPWHVAYSWMNMPEALGTFWVALAFYGVAHAVTPSGLRVPPGGPSSADRRDGAFALGSSAAFALLLAGFFGALTRNDVTSVLALTGAALVVARRPRAALLLFAGLLGGLAVWSAWTGIVTGNPLWWLARRAAGSTGDAGFWIERGSRPSGAAIHLLSAWMQACTVAFVAVLGGVWALRAGDARARFRALRPAVPLLVGGVYVAIVGWMFGRFFSWPDPRYLVMAIVPLTLATVLGVAALESGVAGRARRVLLGVAVVSLILQMPTFPIRAWAHERDRVAGEAMAGLAASGALPPGPIWIDAPVAVQTSGIDLARIRSSDQITGWDGSDETARAAAESAVRQDGIGVVYWDEVPYSRVHRIWPEMADGRAFERNGLRFVPVFRSDTVSRPGEADWIRHLRERVQAKYSPTMLWRVEF